jgi:hypothetical protein
MTNLTITQAQAEKMFLNYTKEVSASGVAFSNLTYFTDESKAKVSKGKKMLQKLVNTNATIGSDYAKKVNRILHDKQGNPIDFVAQKMRGKKYVTNGQPVATDEKTETKLYLVFIVEGHTIPQSQLYLNGQPVDRKDVWNADYIQKSYLENKPTTAGRGLIDEEHNFHFRTLNFDNLISFKMNGTLYTIER